MVKMYYDVPKMTMTCLHVVLMVGVFIVGFWKEDPVKILDYKKELMEKIKHFMLWMKTRLGEMSGEWGSLFGWQVRVLIALWLVPFYSFWPILLIHFMSLFVWI